MMDGLTSNVEEFQNSFQKTDYARDESLFLRFKGNLGQPVEKSVRHSVFERTVDGDFQSDRRTVGFPSANDKFDYYHENQWPPLRRAITPIAEIGMVRAWFHINYKARRIALSARSLA